MGILGRTRGVIALILGLARILFNAERSALKETRAIGDRIDDALDARLKLIGVAHILGDHRPGHQQRLDLTVLIEHGG